MIEKNVIKIIADVHCPWLRTPLSGQAKVAVKGDTLTITLPYYLGGYEAEYAERVQHACMVDKRNYSVEIKYQVPSYQTQLPNIKVHQVKNLIAVSSGKGGVGKTTTTCHLAWQLAKMGAKVGVFDADMYGPNVPLMMGTASQEAHTTPNNQFMPIDCHGMSTMSLAYLIDPEKPMVWRGPMLSKTLLQILMQTKWPPLDYLFIDLPPGTGDTQLTLAQKIPLTGAVVVTTPHPMAQADALKGIKMFEKVNVPLFGQVVNMASQACQQCGHVNDDLLAQASTATTEQVSVLGQVPYAERYARALGESEDNYHQTYDPIAAKLITNMVKLPKHRSSNIPTITTE